MIINRELFEAWLFSQPRERMFDYIDPSNCLICCFLKEVTPLKNPVVSVDKFWRAIEDYPGKPIMLEPWLIEALYKTNLNAYSIGATNFRRTFGEAQDSYLQLFPNTLDSNQSQTEGVTVSPQQQRETAVDLSLKTQ